MGVSPAQIQKAADLKQSLLRAAAQIILQDGVQALTLEAVARQAGASKGALLHHFRTKAELLTVLMADLVERFEAEMERFAADDPDPRGRRTRAFINASANSAAEENRLGVVVAAAFLFDPALMRRWQEVAERLIAQDLAEADPVQASLLRLAADGLWVSEACGLYPMSPEHRAAVVERLLSLTRA
ncbi:TetR/AcrR family transcriptional regulator [Methylobacterium indicum]|uniref:TetR/AcrR family transcriptional regulator n=1 Tax=Methylobacterium indicum TaxID=1775910 RepID=UPI00069E9AE0|nr:TetR/AcrR family transcriptional regulator [Methylobacterium indicum]